MFQRSALFVAALLLIVSLLPCATASAMSAYSRKFNLECSKCHSKVPALNAFGQEFLKNDFELPGVKKVYKTEDELKKEALAPKQQTEQRRDDTAKDDSKGVRDLRTGDPSGGGMARTTGIDGGQQGAATDEPAAKEITPKRETYRWVSQDGSVYFTDNELRVPDPQPAARLQSKRKQKPTVVKKSSGKMPELTAVQAPKPQVAVQSVKPQRYRNYGECMEDRLDDGLVPESADEVMLRVRDAEKACTSLTKN